MSAEQSVVLGLSIIACLFAYFSFSLKDHNETIMRQVSIFFFFMSMLFANMIMYACILIAQNNSLGYLETGVLSVALRVITYTTTGAVILYFIILFVMTVVGVSKDAYSWAKGRSKGENE